MSTVSIIVTGWFGLTFLVLCFFIAQDWWFARTGRALDEEMDTWAAIWNENFARDSFDPETHA